MEDFLEDLEDVGDSGTLKDQKIKHLTDIEHVLSRPQMYIGSCVPAVFKDYIISDDKFILSDNKYVPGLVKIFNELIDNSIDEFVRTKGQYADKIDVELTDSTFSITDNGRGIPVTEVDSYKGSIWGPTLAWTELKAGSNFEDSESSTIGTNGVGSSLCSIFSKEFIGISNDGIKKCTVKCTDNNSNIKTTIGKPTGKQGVKVTMVPDLDRFEINSIDDTHIKMIEQRLHNLSVSYPGITFKFNSKRIKVNAKKFLNMFGDEATIIEEEKFSIGVFHSESDDFNHFSLMNGLTLSAGGTHMDYISGGIVRVLRDKIIKKYKTIKPNDVKRKLFIVIIMKDFKGPKYQTQTKEMLTNPNRDILNYFKGFDIDSFAEKVYRNKAITTSIISYFEIAEEYKKSQDLKGLNKPKKRIKSEKYTKPVGRPKVLLVCEGASAKNALLPGLGRKGLGYYELKGKPLNTYSSNQDKFTKNKELTELYQIIKNEGYEKIAVASDADLDGIAINGLIIAFFKTYLEEELKSGLLYRLNTPVGISKKGTKIISWVYSLKDMNTLKGDVKYMKGLGSWTPEQMKIVLDKDGIDTMLVPLTYTDNSDESIDDWYSSEKADRRKEMIMENTEFSIIKA